MDNFQDIESFVSNVDKISELVQNLKSTDTGIQLKAIEDADRFIAASGEPCKTNFSQTRVNTMPFLPEPTIFMPDQSPDTFIDIMEKDAEDRRNKRMEKEKRAAALKDKGNEAFAQEDYEMAVKYYSEGLAEMKDKQQLYTNRAQAYMKLGKYREVIADCEWALKCNEKCTKAYLHMGKAYLALKSYSESKKCFEKIVEIEPGRKNMIKDYLQQLDLDEKRDIQEKKAKQDFDMGEEKAIAVTRLLKKLSRPGYVPLFYCSALKCLTQAVTNTMRIRGSKGIRYSVLKHIERAVMTVERHWTQVNPHGTGQTLFRLNNGFSIINGNDTVKSCLLKGPSDPFSQELCLSVLKLWQMICCENDENQKNLMACPVFRKCIVEFVLSSDVAVHKASLMLLHLFSQTTCGRQLAADNLDVQMLAKNLMACISKPGQQQQHQQEDTSVKILEIFASENRFCRHLRTGLTEAVTAPLINILDNIESHQPVLPAMLSVIGSVAQDDIIRHKLSHDSDCWKAFLAAIKWCAAFQCKGILYPLLGLMINLSIASSAAVKEHAVSVCGCCLDMLTDGDGGVVTRAAGVLSHVLSQSSEAVECAVQRGVVRSMLRLLKGTGKCATKYAIRTLTVCTAASHFAREELVKADKKLSILRALLQSGCDEIVSGNAALCMAHCLELDGLASKLLDTDTVPLLLCHAAADTKRTAVQQNAAIALGKLCRLEPRHMEKLRELHGLEILLSCAKTLE